MRQPVHKRFHPLLGITVSLGIFLFALLLTDRGRISAESKFLDRNLAMVSGTSDSINMHAGGGAILTEASVQHVIDGDTIELVGGERVRYIGIDAPESADPRQARECLGPESAQRNRELILGHTIFLESDIEDRDRYGRLLRYVYLEDGTMINETLVREGFADHVAFPPNVRHDDRIRSAATLARAEKIGLWGDACVLHPETANAHITTGTSTCTIKGNISIDGERIFHTRGCPYYEETEINHARGDTYFCTEEEAIGAGFRKAEHCAE